MTENQKVEPQPLLAVVLPQPQYEYLRYVFESFVQQGLPAKELGIASETYQRLFAAQQIDFSSLGQAKVEKASHEGVSLSLQETGVNNAGR